MILLENGEVVSDSEGEYGDMPELEDTNDGEKVEYVVGEQLVTWRAFSAQIKVDDLKQ